MKIVFFLLFLLTISQATDTSHQLETTTTNSTSNSTELLHSQFWSYCRYHSSKYLRHYPRYIIKLRQLFQDQEANSSLYHDFCSFEYFQLNKVASLTNDTTVVNKGVALLLGSIFTMAPLYSGKESVAIAKAKRKVNFDLPGQVAYHLPDEDSEEDVTFRVVIRFDASSFGLVFPNFTAKIPLLFAGKHFELQLNPSQSEYLLPATFRWNKTLAAQASRHKKAHVRRNQTKATNMVTHFPKEILPYIYSSYYLVCTNVYRFELTCLIDLREGK